MDRRAYEDDLKRRQQEHLDRVYNRGGNFQPCMHEQCPECIGTGIKHDGSVCIHMISCPCSKCSVTCSC